MLARASFTRRFVEKSVPTTLVVITCNRFERKSLLYCYHSFAIIHFSLKHEAIFSWHPH